MHRSWSFRLWALAFAAATTSAVAVAMRGLVGFGALLGGAVVAAMADGSLAAVSASIRRLVGLNRWLVTLALWYAAGVAVNVFFRSVTEPEWRLVMGPLVNLVALVFALGFMSDEKCHRHFLALLTLMLGVQGFLSANVFLEGNLVAREEVAAASGAWAYGEQGGFALQAMILPVLVAHGLRERGWRRITLLAGCVGVASAVLLSTYATAVALLLLTAPVSAFFVLGSLPRRVGPRRAGLMALTLMLAAGLFVFVMYSDHPLLGPVQARLTTLADDPESGGYSEHDRVGSRWSLAEISIESFRENPLLGAGGGTPRQSPYVGGHSSFLDTLGAYGLLGGGLALAGMVALMTVQAGRSALSTGGWQAIAGATAVVLLAVAGVVNPYWEGLQPAMVLLAARAFRY